MLADVLPNILALAPYESVFGLVCSCRALSRLSIERAKYEIEMPIELGSVTGTATQYPNGWRLRARIAVDGRSSTTTTNIVYKNNVPLAAYFGNDSATWIVSLVTRIYCTIADDTILVIGDTREIVAVCRNHVSYVRPVDSWVADKIAVATRPILSTPPNTVTANTIRAAVKAMNIYARHIGDGSCNIFSEAISNALEVLTMVHSHE